MNIPKIKQKIITDKRVGRGAEIRKAGGYRKYYQSLKQFKLSSNKIGRNEKCPCGSERKYKKCCL